MQTTRIVAPAAQVRPAAACQEKKGMSAVSLARFSPLHSLRPIDDANAPSPLPPSQGSVRPPGQPPPRRQGGGHGRRRGGPHRPVPPGGRPGRGRHRGRGCPAAEPARPGQGCVFSFSFQVSNLGAAAGAGQAVRAAQCASHAGTQGARPPSGRGLGGLRRRNSPARPATAPRALLDAATRALALAFPSPLSHHPTSLFLSLPPLSSSGKFTTVKDSQDGYEFAYPFGWQEVT
jgi:hypothetical protein